MKPHYKFIKPAQPASFSEKYDSYISRFNQIGANAWLGRVKDKIGFLRGDIKKRDEMKDKIKEQLTISQDEYCYYCGRSFYFFGPKETQESYIHIDHILPKNDDNGNYGKYVFEMNNLILACNICNGFNVKGNMDFSTTPQLPYQEMTFSIVHPHFENIEEHLQINEGNGVVEIIHENTEKADLMIKLFGINDEFIGINRLGSIKAINEQRSQGQEDRIDAMVNSIPASGIISKDII